MTHWCALGRRHPSSGPRADAWQPEQGLTEVELRTGAWSLATLATSLRCHTLPSASDGQSAQAGGCRHSVDAAWELPFGLWRLKVDQPWVVKSRLPAPSAVSQFAGVLGGWTWEDGKRKRKTTLSPPLPSGFSGQECQTAEGAGTAKANVAVAPCGSVSMQADSYEDPLQLGHAAPAQYHCSDPSDWRWRLPSTRRRAAEMLNTMCGGLAASILSIFPTPTAPPGSVSPCCCCSNSHFVQK